MSIFITSDWHFNHDREFVYKARGFDSVQEMNEGIIARHNLIVTDKDDVYVLGDLCMSNDLEDNKRLIESMNGRLHIILGNHDTTNRREMYGQCKNVVEMCGHSTIIKDGKHRFYLSHYPTITASIVEGKKFWSQAVNLYGHTHQTEDFYDDNPYMYHVGMDSNNCYPVLLVDIAHQCLKKFNEKI